MSLSSKCCDFNRMFDKDMPASGSFSADIDLYQAQTIRQEVTEESLDGTLKVTATEEADQEFEIQNL